MSMILNGKKSLLNVTFIGGETPQEKVVTPTTEEQVVQADEGYTCLSKVTINGVNSSIDENIQPENIKKDVNILGVTGTLESGGGVKEPDVSQFYVTEWDTLGNPIAVKTIGITSQLPNYFPFGDRSNLLGTYLQKIEINEGVTSVGSSNNGFSRCYQLKRLVLPSTLTNLYFDNYGTSDPNTEYLVLKSTPNVSRFYSDLIVNCLFSGTKEEFETINDSTSNTFKTRTYPFYNCTNVEFDQKLEDFEYIKLDDNRIILTKASRSLNIEDYFSGKTIVAYGKYCFDGERKLNAIPEGVERIGYCGLYYARVYFADNNRTLIMPSTLKIIDKGCFSGLSARDNGYFTLDLSRCSELKNIPIEAFYPKLSSSRIRKVILPEGIERIENKAFYYSYITEINIPSSVTSIGISAFAYSRELQEIDLSNAQITRLNSDTFENSSSLKKVILPDCLTYIDSDNFMGTRIEEITIPALVTNIGSYAFYTSYLKVVKMLPTTPPTIQSSVFYSGGNYLTRIEVPLASLEAYQTATNWSAYASKMVGV